MPTDRKAHLDWCKSRALEELEHNGTAAGIASMLSDLRKWDGGQMYEPELLRVLMNDATTRDTPAGVRHWIEGFN